MSYTTKQTFESSDCNEFDVYDESNTKVAYYVEHFVHCITLEKLEHTMYEIYCFYDDEQEEFIFSQVFDTKEELNEFINTEVV